MGWGRAVDETPFKSKRVLRFDLTFCMRFFSAVINCFGKSPPPASTQIRAATNGFKMGRGEGVRFGGGGRCQMKPN